MIIHTSTPDEQNAVANRLRAKIGRHCRMILSEGHPDAVWVPDRGWMESNAAFTKRIKETLSDKR